MLIALLILFVVVFLLLFFFTYYLPDLLQCTPLGCIELLKHSNVKVSGTKAVVIGRSILVGKPVSMLLQSLDATVTMCHSKSTNLEAMYVI